MEAKISTGLPREDGFYMPGEFEPHRGCIMIWPERPGSWPFGAKAARFAFKNVQYPNCPVLRMSGYLRPKRMTPGPGMWLPHL